MKKFIVKIILCVLCIFLALASILFIICMEDNYKLKECEIVNGFVIEEAVYGNWPNNKEMVVECEDGTRLTCFNNYVPKSTMISFKKGDAVVLTIKYRFSNNSVGLEKIQRNVNTENTTLPEAIKKDMQIEGVVKQVGIYSRWWDNKREMVVERKGDGLRIKVYSGDTSYDIMESFKVGDNVLITVKQWYDLDQIAAKMIQIVK